MKLPALCLSLLLVGGLGASFLASLNAAITAEQRKELAEIKKDLGKVQGLLSKKEGVDEAEKIVNDAETKLKKIATDAGVKETDPAIGTLLKQVELKRVAVGRKKPGGATTGGVSFTKDVAPIISKNCLGCHGANAPKGGLRMDTFAQLEQGGDTKPLLILGDPNGSLIMRRLTQTGNNRMPKGAQALPQADLQKIALWISQGAKFDGSDKADAITDSNPNEPPVQIVKATGSESVSFVRDIAPFMVNLCVGCHSGANPRAGFSLDTFEKLMRGGKNGRVILPGNPDDSRLWHLVGLQDPIKMPMGQALITRKNHANLKIWITEGAKFDGGDAKVRLATLVPTAEEAKAKELASLTAADLLKVRKDRTNELWKAGLPKETMTQVEATETITVGNASESRLKEISGWAEDDVKTLRKVFSDKGDQVWRGKLALFVFKDRFSYEEFARTNERLEIPAEATGHSRVSASMEDAYICLQDIGDAPTDTSPGLRVALLDHLTAAMLQRSARKIPDWVARGTGLALAAKAHPKNPYFAGLNSTASDIVRTLDKPADIFNDGTFSPGTIGPVGYTLVTHMLQAGGEPQFVRFLNQLQSNGNLNTALNSVYSADPTKLAMSYVTNLANARSAVKKKK